MELNIYSKLYNYKAKTAIFIAIKHEKNNYGSDFNL